MITNSPALARIKFKKMPSVETLNTLLLLDRENGCLYWKERERGGPFSNGWNGAMAGKKAFMIKNIDGYMTGKLLQKVYFAHRIIWKMTTGNDPEYFIDHINGDKSDNRPSNLREATHSENCRNRVSTKNKSSKFLGVMRNPQNPKINPWIAKIRSPYGKQIILGRFQTEIEAAIAYNIAAQKHHGAFARLNEIKHTPDAAIPSRREPDCRISADAENGPAAKKLPTQEDAMRG